MTDHEHLREDLGAYVLGALEPAQRRDVEAHLSECPTCRDTVAQLSSLPPLLGRLGPDEARDGLLAPPEGLLSGALERIADSQRSGRRRLRAWRLAAVAAVLVAIVGFVPWPSSGPDVREAPVQAVAEEAAGVSGTAGALAWEWGTTVQLDVEGLPVREAYELWVVSEDGEREQAGTWGPTAGREARVRGACSIQRERLERVEVTDTAGELLFRFEF